MQLFSPNCPSNFSSTIHKVIWPSPCAFAPGLGQITWRIVLQKTWGAIWKKSSRKSRKKPAGERWGCEFVGTLDSGRKLAQSWNQIQTLKDCLCTHIYCAQPGTSWDAIDVACCAVSNRESWYRRNISAMDFRWNRMVPGALYRSWIFWLVREFFFGRTRTTFSEVATLESSRVLTICRVIGGQTGWAGEQEGPRKLQCPCRTGKQSLKPHGWQWHLDCIRHQHAAHLRTLQTAPRRNAVTVACAVVWAGCHFQWDEQINGITHRKLLRDDVKLAQLVRARDC